MTNRAILIVSNEPYANQFGSTNRQRLARAAARDGWEVTYLETIGFGKSTSERVGGIVVVHAFNLLPFAAQPANSRRRSLNAAVTSTLPAIKRRFDLVVCYDPFAAPLLRRLDYGRLIYDCVDAYDMQPQYWRVLSASLLLAAEADVAKMSHVRTATSLPLAKRRSIQWQRHVSVLEGAHEIDSIPPSEASADSDTGLLVGSLDSYKLDVATLLDWLSSNETRRIIAAGSTRTGVDAPVNALLTHPRVEFVGPIDGDGWKVQAARSSFGIVALAPNPYNIYSFPLKTWDYLMHGLPVLAWNAPALDEVEFVLDGASARTSFDQRGSARERMTYASRYHADERWANMVRLV